MSGATPSALSAYLRATEPAYPPRTFPCPWCNSTMDSMQNWRGHASKMHPGTEDSTEYREMVDMIHQGVRRNPIICPVYECGHTFGRYGSMITHYKKAHSDAPTPCRRRDALRCTYCLRVFFSTAAAVEHIRRAHAEHFAAPQGGEIEDGGGENGDEILEAIITDPPSSQSDATDVISISPVHKHPQLTLKRAADHMHADAIQPAHKRARANGLSVRVPVIRTVATPTIRTRTSTPVMYRVTTPEDPNIVLFHLDGMPLPKLSGPLVLERVTCPVGVPTTAPH